MTSFKPLTSNLSRYLECVSKNMQKLQPFGDVPKKLTLQLRRSFVATRTFSQALSEGKKVLSRILKIQAKDECAEALTKMSSCPACQGLPAIQPCTSYCLNVMKGCLAHHTELHESWDKFVDSLTAVGERLIGPFNIEAVVEPIDIKISDAIMNFQESGYEVTQKVFQDCGQPRLGKRQVSNGGFGYSVPQQSNRQLRPTTAAGTNLDTLVTDIMVKVKDTKGFWTKLPSILCQNPEVGSGKDPVEQNCWNGRDRGYYSNKVNLKSIEYCFHPINNILQKCLQTALISEFFRLLAMAWQPKRATPRWRWTSPAPTSRSTSRSSPSSWSPTSWTPPTTGTPSSGPTTSQVSIRL